MLYEHVLRVNNIFITYLKDVLREILGYYLYDLGSWQCVLENSAEISLVDLDPKIAKFNKLAILAEIEYLEDINKRIIIEMVENLEC